ncbi:MAG: hypothetical protein HY001_01970 [Candidatus Portnoybacteria bacterium]|nr:hypothetical protein [Candidatus Portnoybacteria bacterium]
MDRRSFLGIALAVPFVVPLRQRRLVSILNSLEAEGVRYILEYYPDRVAYLVREIEIGERIFCNLTFEIVGPRGIWYPIGDHISADTVMLLPDRDTVRWWAGKEEVPL